jgi:hypothetical protein
MFIIGMYDKALKSSGSSKKRKRVTCSADTLDKDKTQRMVEFDTGNATPLRVCQQQLKKWTVLSSLEARSLNEEVIFYVTNVVNETTVHALSMNAKRLVVVKYGSERFATTRRPDYSNEMQTAELLTNA